MGTFQHGIFGRSKYAIDPSTTHSRHQELAEKMECIMYESIWTLYTLCPLRTGFELDPGSQLPALTVEP